MKKIKVKISNLKNGGNMMISTGRHYAGARVDWIGNELCYFQLCMDRH